MRDGGVVDQGNTSGRGVLGFQLHFGFVHVVYVRSEHKGGVKDKFTDMKDEIM